MQKIKMRKGSSAIAVFFLLFTFPLFAQVVLEQRYDVPFSNGEQSPRLAWGGGLNSGQYNRMDLDGDGSEELVIYDRSADNFQIFRRADNDFVPANELAILLPSLQRGWVLFVDYNNDGKKDIFSYGLAGTIVHKNIAGDGEPVRWKKVADPLFTTGYSGKINLIVNSADVPAIVDIDSDGDVDILVYNFAIGGYIRYNKNMSMEYFGHADSLEYLLETRRWGQFEECDCNDFKFSGESCSNSSGRVQHPGGKALMAFDADGDGDMDLTVGHEQCTELYFYENRGDIDSAYMIDYSNMFPDSLHPANFNLFPAGYFIDLDYDGVKDLAVTPSFEDNYNFKIDFAHSNWYYHNKGRDDHPEFSFVLNDFLQGEMMDFGENAMPFAADVDADGSTDLLVAANGFWNGEYYSGRIIYIRNEGSAGEPAFIVQEADYAGLSSLKLINPKIAMADLNGDNAPDLIYTGMRYQDFKESGWYILNEAGVGSPFVFDVNKRQVFTLPERFEPGDTPSFFDVDSDGNPDLLVGKKNGALEYHRNSGDNTFVLEDPDFLGIERDFSGLRVKLTAFPADLDMDGKADLIVANSTKTARVYFDFQEQIDMEPDFVGIVMKNEVSGREEPILFDDHTWIAGADFYGKATMSLIAGGVRGGLQMFMNPEGSNGGGQGPVLEVKIYPNPISATPGLHIRSNRDVSVEVLTVLGQQVIKSFPVKKFSTVSFDTGFLRNGTYILKAVTDSGAVNSQLFLVLR